MTGYTVHTGSTEKFSEGWDKIFKSGAKKKAGGKAPTKSVAAKGAPKAKAKAKAKKKKT